MKDSTNLFQTRSISYLLLRHHTKISFNIWISIKNDRMPKVKCRRDHHHWCTLTAGPQCQAVIKEIDLFGYSDLVGAFLFDIIVIWFQKFYIFFINFIKSSGLVWGGICLKVYIRGNKKLLSINPFFPSTIFFFLLEETVFEIKISFGI